MIAVMNIIQAVVLGVVEGMTEFLPISSTFHLIFSSRFLGIPQSDFTKLFEVFIQAGAILSVALLYFTDVVKSKELIKKVIISFFPTAIVGFLLYKIIKNVFFESTYLMLGVFVIVGIIFIVLEYFVKKEKIKINKDIKELSYKEALLIGLCQSFAVIPGVSRAGAVIMTMMFLKYKRDKAAYYSFFLAVPTILAASFFDLFQMRKVLVHNFNNNIILVTGLIAAFVSSYMVIKWFIDFLKKNSLTVFGIYRILLAIILLLMMVK